MSDKKFDELQKLYDSTKIGSLVQEICEYYSTQDGYEDNSYQDEIEPTEIVESIYVLFCLQSREQILYEMSLVQKKFPAIYSSIKSLHNTLLINMDYQTLEKSCAEKISSYAKNTTCEEVLSHADSFSRSSNSLAEAEDKFYTWLHSRSR